MLKLFENKHPITIGIICFFISIVALKLFFGPVSCVSGWVSPSIGSSGACSHHGGVANQPIGILALIVGVVAWNIANKRKIQNASKNDETLNGKDKEKAKSKPINQREYTFSNANVSMANDAELFKEYKNQGGPLTFEKWQKSREWLNDTDWSKRQDKREMD